MPGTVISRQSGMAAAIVLRSAGAIRPSFSPHSTKCGCQISAMRRSRSPLSRSRLRLKGVPNLLQEAALGHALHAIIRPAALLPESGPLRDPFALGAREDRV